MPNQLVVEEIDEHEAYFQIIGSRFPHIEERLRLMWGTPEVATYLQDLTISNRGDARGVQGSERTDPHADRRRQGRCLG